MATFAVLVNNKVTNVIVAESKEDAETATDSICVETDTAGIGWNFDPETNTFINPQEEA